VSLSSSTSSQSLLAGLSLLFFDFPVPPVAIGLPFSVGLVVLPVTLGLSGLCTPAEVDSSTGMGSSMSAVTSCSLLGNDSSGVGIGLDLLTMLLTLLGKDDKGCLGLFSRN